MPSPLLSTAEVAAILVDVDNALRKAVMLGTLQKVTTERQKDIVSASHPSSLTLLTPLQITVLRHPDRKTLSKTAAYLWGYSKRFKAAREGNYLNADFFENETRELSAFSKQSPLDGVRATTTTQSRPAGTEELASGMRHMSIDREDHRQYGEVSRDNRRQSSTLPKSTLSQADADPEDEPEIRKLGDIEEDEEDVEMAPEDQRRKEGGGEKRKNPNGEDEGTGKSKRRRTAEPQPVGTRPPVIESKIAIVPACALCAKKGFACVEQQMPDGERAKTSAACFRCAKGRTKCVRNGQGRRNTGKHVKTPDEVEDSDEDELREGAYVPPPLFPLLTICRPSRTEDIRQAKS